MRIPDITIPTKAFNPAKEHVVFRLPFAKRKGKYGCGKLNAKQIQQTVKKLKEYQRLTVIQFRQNSSVRLKSIRKKEFPNPPAELSEEIRDMLGYEIRTTGKFRIMGYFCMSEFYILWFDPNHSFCD